MNINRKHVLAALIVLALTSSLIGQQASHDTKSGQASLYRPAEIQWKDGPASLPPGTKMAVLEGDPAQEGMFVMRIRMPDGYHVPAHTHPKHERVTVMQGTLQLAMGDKLKLADARIMPAGTFGVWPPGMVHTAWAKGETILQIHGIGPWIINYVNPNDDPRNAKK